MRLVLVFGPPAVGKMTVGRELCRRTGYKLLHNHMTVEPVLDIFAFGSPPFTRLVRNRTELRLAEKRSKRDLDFSDANVRDLDERYRMNTGDEPTPADPVLARCPHVRIENTHLSAEEVADRVVVALGL